MNIRPELNIADFSGNYGDFCDSDSIFSDISDIIDNAFNDNSDKNYEPPEENDYICSDSPEAKNKTKCRNINELIQWDCLNIGFTPRFEIPPVQCGKILHEFGENAKPFDVWRRLFPRSLVNYLAQCTNERVAFDKVSGKNAKKTTDGGEMLIMLGCSIVMGFNTLPDLSCYWSMHKSLSNELICSAISRDRLSYLMSKLYCNDSKKTDEQSKTHCIDSVVNCLKGTFLSTFSDSSRQSIDESVIKFKGRFTMKVNKPMTATKYGIKLWQRCDSLTGYTYDFHIYTSRELDGHRNFTLGERVINKLCSSVKVDPCNVAFCFDISLSSIHVFRRISFPAVGAYLLHRSDAPTFDKKLEKEESQFVGNNFGTIAVKWRNSKEEVNLLSNCHKDSLDVTSRKMKDGTEVNVSFPDACVFYNSFVGGFERSDKTVSKFDFERKSSEWWKKVFYRLLKISVINSWILYNKLNGDKTCSLYRFLIYLSEEMIEQGKKETKRPFNRPKHQIRPLKRKRIGTRSSDSDLNTYKHLPSLGINQRRCQSCSMNGLKITKTKIMCVECDAPMCIKCFAPYHLGTLNK